MKGFPLLEITKAIRREKENKSLTGFTLVEILLVIAIFAILISFLVPIGLNFYKSQQLEFQSQGILQTLRRAQ